MASQAQIRYQRVLAKQRDGESLRALAERCGVKPRTLYYWHQRLAKRAREENALAPPQILPVEIAGSLLGFEPPSRAFEVALRVSGHVLRVPPEFNPETLRRLVETLERA